MDPPALRLDRLLSSLRHVVGEEHVLTEADMVAGYVRDWTGRWTGTTAAVVRPGTTDQVRAVVDLCADARIPLVPQGGNTGLVGGSVPHGGEVVLSMRRLDQIGDFRVGDRSVVAGAGVTLGALQAHARKLGLAYGVDIASRDSATIGGTIATNAGGINVVANGDTRRQIVGMEAVFADGTVVSTLERPVKESAGPDLLQLLVGSEGTIGVVTAARLRLLPAVANERLVVLVGLQRLSQGLDLMGPGVRALEFLDAASLDLVVEERGLSRPLPGRHPFYALVESTSAPDLSESVPAVVDERLWAYRESITETINQLGVPVKLDVAVPLGRVDDFAATVYGLDLEGRVFLFGHLAEGNFHVNVVGDPNPDEVVDRVLGTVVDHGGVIASEHGIGVAKSEWWRRTADPGTLAFQRRLKETLDPGFVFNPRVFWG